MSDTNKYHNNILNKLKIEKLNPMQEEAITIIKSKSNIVLLSPTGTGKTLAFLLPIIAELDINCKEIQALIVVPTRELAIQIEQVIRQIGAGFKVNAVYGGRAGNKDKIEIKHRPAVLIGTPGRLADHIRRENFSTDSIKTLVLDEFDKSLEIGFESEMTDIISALPYVSKRILTSATHKEDIPEFAGMKNPTVINYLGDRIKQLKVETVISPSKDKLDTLVDLLSNIGNKSGIIFCNFKETIQRVSDYLEKNSINHGCFHGSMEQQDRERELIKFRNGTHQLIVATDLAARGIDVPDMKFIIHYQLPLREKEFIHRNGRTARMNSEGTAFVLKWENESLPDFINDSQIIKISKKSKPIDSKWKTLYVSGGRKDKISKGDIAGFFIKQGKLSKEELGIIEVKQDCAFVAVHSNKANQVIETLNNNKIKKRKVRISII